MFGTPFRSLRRPILLIVVFGFFLMIVGLTALSQAIIVSTQSSQTMLNAIVGSDAATVRGFANAYLVPADLATRRSVRDPRRRPPGSGQDDRLRDGEILRIEVRSPDGTLLLSDTADPAGARGAPRPTSRPRLAERSPPGSIRSPMPSRSASPCPPATSCARTSRSSSTGEVVAVVGHLERCGADPRGPRSAPSTGHDRHPVRRRPGGRRPVPRVPGRPATHPATDRRAARGDAAGPDDRHAESRRPGRGAGGRDRGGAPGRRDPRDRAARHRQLPEPQPDLRPSGRRPGTHRRRRRCFATCFPRRRSWGRYGPDEFLVIVASDATIDLEPTIELVRTRLVDLSLQFETSERLPITVSAGICAFPINGESVTTLLSSASRTLDEAKASGGDSVRVAEADAVPLEEAVRFDVLEGLIIAVDTKDHYTRRHSEDVARYAGIPGRPARSRRGGSLGGLSGRSPPRHRQDRDPRPHPAQARRAHRSRVRGR